MLKEQDIPKGILRSVMLCGALTAALVLGACDQQGTTGTGTDDNMPAADMADTGGSRYMEPAMEADPEVVAARRARVNELAAGWPEEPVYAYAFDSLDPSLSVAVGGEVGAMFNPADDYWGLPRTEGYMLVDQNCTACHSIRIVMQQHATVERWDHLLDWMVETQGMWELPDDERATILAYLSENFGATTAE